MKTPLTLALLATLAGTTPVLAAPMHPFDGMDPQVRPQDDLFRNANGTWLAKTTIPGDRTSFGVFDQMWQRSDDDVKALLEGAKRHPGHDPETRMLGDFYGSLTDTAELDKAGIRPLTPFLTRIQGLKATSDLPVTFATLMQAGVRVPLGTAVYPDEKHPDLYTVYLSQDGLGLPNRDYYLKTGKSDETLRQNYVAYLTQLDKLSGAAHPAEDAKAVLAFETELAKVQWTEVDNRDDLKTYNPTAHADWLAKYGPFDWESLAKGIGMPKDQEVVVSQPSYFLAFAKMADTTPLSTWQAYLRLRVLDDYAANLSAPYRAAFQKFHRAQLRGLTQEPPRWRTAIRFMGDAVGEAIGSRYVTKHFPPASKARAKQLVSNLLAAYHERFQHVSWMTPETRDQALDKLSKITVKIGYPDQWRGYQGLRIDRHDATGNLIRTSQFLYARNMRDTGHAVDRSRWDMTPQTVNAYYNPLGNEIVFPAAILQPPFFDAKADDAYNYGAIGAVIGHETSHGFDDQGRHFDADGKLRDWWTAEDGKAFVARADRLVKQYDGYEPLKGEHVNGRLTLGENIADLTGVDMALQAYHYALHGKKAPIIAGWTGDQRFFLSYARVWRNKNRPEWLHQRILSDPHSPEQYRTNGVVSNLNGFYDAFGLKPGDGMYKASEDRVRIW